MSDLICLLVDDEPFVRNYLQDVLKRKHFKCLEAGNAREAMRIVQKLEGRIDLIVSDIKMPGDMDGLDLAHFVRKAFTHLPVILVSGYADDEHDSADFQFVQKPFVPEAILRSVEKAIGSLGNRTRVSTGQ